MSRWREMLMDYGQLMDQTSGKKSQGSVSDFASVDGDRMVWRTEDQRLRRVMETHFRPLFQSYVYGGEKIACHDLQRVLRDPQYRDLLPPNRVHELADLAEFNMGRSVNYGEFVRIVMGRSPPEDTISFSSGPDDRRYRLKPPEPMSTICRNTAPQEEVSERLDGYRCLPPAFFIIAITIVQVVLYFVYTEDSPSYRGPLRGNVYENKLVYRPDRRREAWRFVTYCFIHDGYVDLIFNVVLQLTVCLPLEIVFSFWRIMLVYFAGVIAGSIGHSVSDHDFGLTGAAGGCYAMIAGNIVAIICNWSNYNKVRDESTAKRALCSPLLRILLILLIVIAQTVLGIVRRFEFEDGMGGFVHYPAGLVTGIVMSVAFLQDPKRLPWRSGAGYLNFFTFLFIIGAGIIFNIVYPWYPAEQYP